MGSDVQVDLTISGSSESSDICQILPNGELPNEAKLFLEDATDKESSTIEKRQFTDAAAWLAEAIIYAHTDDRLAAAANSLMKVNYFMINLGWARDAFHNIIRPRLVKRLEELRKRAQLTEFNVGEELHTSLIPLLTDSPNGCNTDPPNEHDSMPTQLSRVPFALCREHIDSQNEVYAHVLLMVAHGLDEHFHQKAAAVITNHCHSHSNRPVYVPGGPKPLRRLLSKAAQQTRFRTKWDYGLGGHQGYPEGLYGSLSDNLGLTQLGQDNKYVLE